MDGEQLKRWRTNRNLTQEQLAERLGWTRDKVASAELGRTPIKEDLTARLGAIDADLASQPAKAPPKTRMDRWRDDERPCWTTYGQKTTMVEVCANIRPNALFFRRDNEQLYDELSGHPIANLWIWAYKSGTRSLHPHCTHIHLDLATMRAECVKVRDKVSLIAVDTLNQHLAGAQQALASAESIAANNPGMFAVDVPQ